MSDKPYTLPEWTEFCEKILDRFTIFGLPITEKAYRRAFPSNKKHCTIANSLADHTGMDPDYHQIEVDVKFIKFVLNNKRYFLFHEVAGAEHIKQLDTLALAEEGKARFTPFILKLRFHEERPVYNRPRVAKPVLVTQENKQESTSVKADGGSKKHEQELSKSVPSAMPMAVNSNHRAPRRDTGIKKSRWAR